MAEYEKDESYRDERDRAFARLATALSDSGAGAPAEAARNTRAASYGRQLAMYICHVAFGMSLTRIGRAFRRDRSTVSWALHVMEDRRDDKDFDALCEALEAAARAAPAPAVTLSEAAS
jgi:hypothetical protein